MRLDGITYPGEVLRGLQIAPEIDLLVDTRGLGECQDLGNDLPPFDVEVNEDAIARQLEHLVQCGQLFLGKHVVPAAIAVPQFQTPQLQGQFLGLLLHVCHALERIVMQQEEPAVGSTPHIDLDHAVTCSDRALDSQEAVFRRCLPNAAMHDNGARTLRV